MVRSPVLALALILVSACSASSDEDGGSNAGTEDGSKADTVETSDDSGADLSECEAPGLVWHTANKTNYESYPAPGSEECVVYNGCEYLGEFAACENTMPETWVASHDIVSVFPLGDLALHRLCLRAGDQLRVVTVIDTCADSDCDGCCSENRGDAEALIDIETYTDARFGVEDGPIEWADLGAGDPSFDGCN